MLRSVAGTTGNIMAHEQVRLVSLPDEDLGPDVCCPYGIITVNDTLVQGWAILS